MTTILYLYYFIINLTGAVLSRTNINFSFFLNGHINYIMLHKLCHPIKFILYIMCDLPVNMCILCTHWEFFNEIMSVLAWWSKDSDSEFLSMLLDPTFLTGKNSHTRIRLHEFHDYKRWLKSFDVLTKATMEYWKVSILISLRSVTLK